MGMWSRPSKQLSEGGQIGFPNSPPPFFGDASTASINDDDHTTTAVATATATAAPTPVASSLAGYATAMQLNNTAPEGNDPPHEPADSGTGASGDLATGEKVDTNGEGRAANETASKLSNAQAESPVTPVRVSREKAAAAGGTPQGRSPETGERDGVEALLLVRRVILVLYDHRSGTLRGAGGRFVD